MSTARKKSLELADPKKNSSKFFDHSTAKSQGNQKSSGQMCKFIDDPQGLILKQLCIKIDKYHPKNPDAKIPNIYHQQMGNPMVGSIKKVYLDMLKAHVENALSSQKTNSLHTAIDDWCQERSGYETRTLNKNSTQDGQIYAFNDLTNFELLKVNSNAGQKGLTRAAEIIEDIVKEFQKPKVFQLL